MDVLLIKTLPIELTNGNNGRGNKWYRSSNVRKAIETKLRAMDLVREPFEFPVTISLTRILGPRQGFWDADSILRGNSKELIDALVAVGWFHDDGPKFVTGVSGWQDASQRDNGPAVVVEVRRSEL